MIKQRAEQLRDGVMRSRGHALLPIMLASFIYDALDVPSMEYYVFNTHICLEMNFLQINISLTCMFIIISKKNYVCLLYFINRE